jgi:lipid-A-disaccharide synthase-like uncharacterized protein
MTLIHVIGFAHLSIGLIWSVLAISAWKKLVLWKILVSMIIHAALWPMLFVVTYRDFKKKSSYLKPFSFWRFVFFGKLKF